MFPNGVRAIFHDIHGAVVYIEEKHWTMFKIHMKECKCVKKFFLPQMADFSWGVRKMKSNLSSNPRRKNFQSNEKSPIPDKFQRLL